METIDIKAGADRTVTQRDMALQAVNVACDALVELAKYPHSKLTVKKIASAALLQISTIMEARG